MEKVIYDSLNHRIQFLKSAKLVKSNINDITDLYKKYIVDNGIVLRATYKDMAIMLLDLICINDIQIENYKYTEDIFDCLIMDKLYIQKWEKFQISFSMFNLSKIIKKIKPDLISKDKIKRLQKIAYTIAEWDDFKKDDLSYWLIAEKVSKQ